MDEAWAAGELRVSVFAGGGGPAAVEVISIVWGPESVPPLLLLLLSLLSLLFPPSLLDDAVMTDVCTMMDPGRGVEGSLGAGVGWGGPFGVDVSGEGDGGATMVVGATDVVWTTMGGAFGEGESGLCGKETGDDAG